MDHSLLEDIRGLNDKDRAIELFKEAVIAFHDECNILMDKIKNKDVILDFYQDQIVSLSDSMILLLEYLKKTHGDIPLKGCNDDSDTFKAINILTKGLTGDISDKFNLSSSCTLPFYCADSEVSH